MESSLRVSAIAAIGRNRELGKAGELVWRIPDDLKRVKELTTDNAIIMGRKTYESIGRPLPNRLNIILTRNPEYKADGCIVVQTLDAAFAAARDAHVTEIFIFGGAEIYKEAMPLTTRLYLTLIDAEDASADAFFPDYREFTTVIEKEKRDHDGLAYEWLTLERT